jgi:hypothetical protein
MTRLTIALGALLVAAQSATAQSVPDIMKPKQVAQRAVAATNAQVAANTTLAEDTSASTADAAIEARSSDSAVTGSAPSNSAGAADAKAATKAPGAAGFQRETFAYQRIGRRDPFVSLMNTSELRPLVTDLKLVAVAFDPTGRNSVAILHDLGTKDQYRIRVGQSLGRMRVSNITTRTVVFTIEEFGYSRQETLALGDSNKERKQ